MSDKRLEVEEIVSVLKELECHRLQQAEFCLFSDGTGRIGQGGQSIESWNTIEELTERIRSRDRESKRDLIVREAVSYFEEGRVIHALEQAVRAFLKSESKDEESNDEPT